ncbi:MAG: DGQHR domain-containing protein [Desulfarculaceae bacterium]|nr:DGQHR domain-containing protein [Desulfarculaceae bacterium]MCF8121659.1 DGQHR domain-containing protein [Desulfarculaceae bacterium]
MKSNRTICFPCIEVAQPIGTFYVGAIGYKDLIHISKADIRRISERDVEMIVGVQRPLVSSRVEILKQYVNTIDAAFPTGVILAIERGRAEYDKHERIMRISNEKDIAKIIDGQHRIAGLEGFNGDEFQVNVTIFIDMDLEDQAYVFATINLNQTKVSKSLAYDLNEFAKNRSPHKTCHDIAKLLNYKDLSPLNGRIKILGKATGNDFEYITQAAFVDRLLPYITKDAMADRDSIKRGKKLGRVNSLVAKTIFRNLFIDEKDAEIAKILWNFFTAISQRWPEAWMSKEKGLILNRTQGFAAAMRFLEDVYKNYGKEDRIVPLDYFEYVFANADLIDEDFSTENYPPGTSGESKLYKDLKEKNKVISNSLF